METYLDMAWLINFMTTNIDEDFMFYNMAKEIYDVTEETYLDKKNT